MKIGIIGVYYASNLGDAVICDCVYYWLKQKYPKAMIDVIDIEGKQDFPKQTSVSLFTLKRRKWKLQWDYLLTRYGIKDTVYKWNQLDVAQRQSFYEKIAQKKYDAVVFAGGQLFMDWLSVDICEFLKRFERMGTSVYFNACGMGLSVSKKIRILLSEHLASEHIKLISSRDNIEEIKKRYLSDKREIYQTYDPALWVTEVYKVRKCETGCIGLGIMFCENESIRKVIHFWMELIRELEKRKIAWKMFCNGSIDDYNFGCYVLEKLHLNAKEKMCDCASKPKELVHQIAGFSSIISFRLHSHIIAASLDISAVALVWDEKLRFFYKHLGCEERCKTIFDSAEDILDMLQKAEREGYDRKQIQEQKAYARILLTNTMEQELPNE